MWSKDMLWESFFSFHHMESGCIAVTCWTENVHFWLFFPFSHWRLNPDTCTCPTSALAPDGHIPDTPSIQEMKQGSPW